MTTVILGIKNEYQNSYMDATYLNLDRVEKREKQQDWYIEVTGL